MGRKRTLALNVCNGWKADICLLGLANLTLPLGACVGLLPSGATGMAPAQRRLGALNGYRRCLSEPAIAFALSLDEVFRTSTWRRGTFVSK